MSSTIGQRVTEPQEEEFFEIDLTVLFHAVVKRLWLCIAICTVVIGLGLAYCFMATPLFLANCRMLVEPGGLRVTQIEGVYSGEAGSDAKGRSEFLNTQMNLMTSDHILARVFERFKFGEKPEFEASRTPLDDLRKLVVVEQVPNTSLVDIGFKDPDPKFSAEVSNFIAREYINDSQIRSTGFSERGLERLQDELVNMEQQRFRAIEALNAFKTKHNMLSVETSTKLLVSRLTELGTAMISAKEGLAQAEASVESVNLWRKEGRRLDAIPEAIANPTLSSFKVVRLQAQATLVKSLQDFGPSHKSVATQERVIARMDKAIEEETENSLISLQAKLESQKIRVEILEKETAELTAELQGLDKLSDEYKVLDDNLKAAEKAYQYVLQRVNELQISRSADSGSGGTFQIIVPATPPQKAAYPQKVKTMVILALLAGLSSVVLCILLELLDRTLKNREEFEKRTGLPVFGEIPYAKETDRVDFQAFDDPKGSVAEAFRALRTSISLSPSAGRSKILAVTSSLPGEGKSFVSLNLAVTYARAKKKVLLIDCDMRRRKLTHLLRGDRKDEPGLSSILAGTEDRSNLMSLLEQPFEGLNLSILGSGPIPPNPVELLSDRTAKAFFESLVDEFDIVIVDTAPVLLVADTPNLAAVTDMGFLVVGRVLQTEKAQLDNAVETLRRVNGNILGTVVELSEKAGKSGYGYGYKYGYKYGYSYGNYGSGHKRH